MQDNINHNANYGYTKLLTTEKAEKLSNYYADCSNQLRKTSTEFNGKLCEILITASLAFLAIVTTMLKELTEATEMQSSTVATSILCFVISVSCGILHMAIMISFYNRIAVVYGELSNAYLNNDEEKARKIIKMLKRDNNRSSGRKSLIVQIVFFIIGVGAISISLILPIIQKQNSIIPQAL